MNKDHPLSNQDIISAQELAPYPYISFLYRDGLASEFQEEYLPKETITRSKRIQVNDRQSMMDMIKSSNSYTIGTGLISDKYSTPGVITKELKSNDKLHIGYVISRSRILDDRANAFIAYLTAALEDSLFYKNNHMTNK